MGDHLATHIRACVLGVRVILGVLGQVLGARRVGMIYVHTSLCTSHFRFEDEGRRQPLLVPNFRTGGAGAEHSAQWSEARMDVRLAFFFALPIWKMFRFKNTHGPDRIAWTHNQSINYIFLSLRLIQLLLFSIETSYYNCTP